MKTLQHRRAAGFTLVEVLVGVAIGMIGVVVMFQMVGLWDARTRTATSGGEIQVSGTLAMFNLERDIKQAGMGFGRATAPFMGCDINVIDTAPPRVFQIPMFPVRIQPGAGGAPDIISVFYGDSAFYVEQQTLRFSTATSKTLSRRGGFRTGDLAIVAGNDDGTPGSADCALIEVTNDTNPDNVTIVHGTGNYASFYDAAASGVARFNTAAGTGGVFTSGQMYSLGRNPQYNVWQVNAGGALSVTELIRNTGPVTIAERVVNLKAEYGIDTDADLRVDTWTNVAPANWTTVLALRTAVLFRSQHFEKTTDPNLGTPMAVTPDAKRPAWAGGPFVMTSIDGGADTFGDTQDDPNNWRYYRYRVYERVIPLRNMIWGTAP